MAAAARDEAPLGSAGKGIGAGQVKLAGLAQLLPECLQMLCVTVEQVEDETLEVGGLGDVHRRAGGGVCLAGAAHAIAAGPEELVQHVVLVGGHHQTADGQAHAPGDVTGQHVAEVAAGHGERDLRRAAVGIDRMRGSGLQVAPEVVDHLGHHARPVDGVDAADVVALLERQIGGQGLDQVLAVVEHALDGDVVDVVVHQAEHLGALEGAHPSGRRQHEDAQPLAATHGVFGRTAGVTRGGAHDVEPTVLLEQRVLEEPTQQLHGHVLEGQRGAIGQVLHQQRTAFGAGRFQLGQRGDGPRAEDLCRVGFLDQPFQVVGGNVVAVAAEHLEGQLGI